MTRLRQMMLEELERRNYSKSTKFRTLIRFGHHELLFYGYKSCSRKANGRALANRTTTSSRVGRSRQNHDLSASIVSLH